MNAAWRLIPGSGRAARPRLKLCRALLSPLVLTLLIAPDLAAQTRVGAATAGESRVAGAITGRVLGEDGQPLAHARVMLSRMSGTSGFATSAQSDEDGRFTFSNLAFDAYLVSASAPGYVLEPDPFEQPGARIYHHVGDSVTLRMVKGGVITGMVTNTNGEPLVGMFVDAARVRYADGRVVREGAGGRIFQPRQTDDRGVYRIYGLRPGAYIIRAGGRNSFGQFTPYDLKVPTYYPSATREGATHVSVQAGSEISGLDIRYRGEAGHAISGTITGALPPNYQASDGMVIALKHVSASAPEQYASFLPDNSGFVFEGVADGDYDLLARRDGGRDDSSAASPPRRVNVRGRDVSGITLVLAPLGSVSGQLLFDPAKSPEDNSACRPARAPRAVESIVVARRDDSSPDADQSLAFFPDASETVPGDTGAFQLRNLKSGRYQLLVRLPTADFYVRDITPGNTPAKNTAASPAAAPIKSAKPAQAASVPLRGGFSLQTGERLSNLHVHVAAGASGLRGRVAAAADDDAGASSAHIPHLRVHLIPAEREQADNVLRYAESPVAADGTFVFANLAPGRYWLLARPAADSDSPDNSSRPLAWDVEARARLRREAETANALITLAPCQRIADFVLSHAAK